ncbi:membrane protein [Caballeronia jiangsuensis]|nr:membrane protein [Caballeronia jiangsuensis]
MTSLSGQELWLTPAFKRLVARRRRFIARLTLGTLVPYYAFVLVAGFAPKLLSAKMFGASAITTGWTIGVLIIAGTWLLTGLYIHRANGEFDALTNEILNGGAQ